MNKPKHISEIVDQITDEQETQNLADVNKEVKKHSGSFPGSAKKLRSILQGLSY